MCWLSVSADDRDEQEWDTGVPLLTTPLPLASTECSQTIKYQLLLQHVWEAHIQLQCYLQVQFIIKTKAELLQYKTEISKHIQLTEKLMSSFIFFLIHENYQLQTDVDSKQGAGVGNASQDLALLEPVPEPQGKRIWPEASGKIVITDNTTNLLNGEGVRQPTKNHRPHLHF